MKIIVSLIILGLCLFSASADAQTRKRKKSAKTKTVKTIPKTISAGVVNGKAINLVTPVYPESAWKTRVYGRVNVKILIDETGTVISAEAISGHLLLRGASVRAALQSKFQPITLSGNPVRVNGIIVYNFLASQWNWLEIGYAVNYNFGYYNIGDLLDLLPSDFAEETNLLKQYFAEKQTNKDFLQSIIASFQVKLSDKEKDFWLFSVGLWLGKANRCCLNEVEKQQLIGQIEILMLSKPRACYEL